MTGPDPAPDEPSGSAAPGGDGAPGDDEVAQTVAALAEADLQPAQRRRLLRPLVDSARQRGLGGMFRPKTALRWIADTVIEIAPHVPVRDLATLRVHHDGLDGEELAERLIRNAARATGGVGAVGGGFASVHWVVAPTLLSAPVLLTAETVAVVAIEVKLIGELHEVYRQPVPGSSGHRAVALVQAWAQRRGVNPLVPGVGAAAVLGTAARKELRDRLLRRFGRNLTTLGPMLTGAAVATYLNRRATQMLGDSVRTDLRRRARAVEAA